MGSCRMISDKKSSRISYVVHNPIRISLAERPMSIDDLKQRIATLADANDCNFDPNLYSLYRIMNYTAPV